MADENKCPHCGKPVPSTALGGICPECMLKAGLAAQTEGPGAIGPQGTRIVQPPPTPAEIASLFPQLEILECLGRGGMGVVYKARQPRLNRLVALKILARDKEQDGQFAERFTREAQALARLNHPNIVTVHDFGEAGGHCYLVMEFVDGVNLRQVLLAGKMPPEQALTIVPKICEALQYAHEQGIVHRDIKPENILVDKSGRVKIADFGIAKMLGVTAGQQALTGAKDVVGTPHYMAPEQLEKPLTVDHRADIYSLGVVFYEMLTGELPLGKFAPPSRKVQIDVRLDEVVLHTLEKEPARRYQQVNQLKTDVETIAGTVHSAKGSPAPLLASLGGIPTSDKAIIPALLMAIFFGVFGAHRFYVGKMRTALLQLGLWFGCILLIIGCATTGSHYQPTLGILLGFSIFGSVIWATIDWILILCKAFTDGEGKRITHWTHSHYGGMTTGHETVTGSPASPPATAPAAKAGAAPSSAAPPAFASTPSEKQPGTVPPAGTLPPAVLAGRPADFNRAKVIVPAVGLMVAAALKLFGALTALFFFASPVREILDNVFSSLGMNSFLPWHTLGVLSTLFFKVIPALLMLVGAVKMLQLRSYAWSIAAAILAIVCCSLIGFPVGIWALVVLTLPDVRAAFARQPEPAAAPAKIWPWLAGAAALGLILLVALGLSVLSSTIVKPALPNVTVRGTVTDAVNGKPIAAARVDDNRYGADTDKAPRQAWTDKKGHYKLKTWYEEHTIAASAPGYAPGLNTLFTKSSGSEREVWMDFKLQPADTNAPPAPVSGTGSTPPARPGIERATVAADKAVIEGQGSTDGRILFSIGSEEQWSCGFLENTGFTAILSLDWMKKLHCAVNDADGNSLLTMTVDESGPIKFSEGRIVFHVGMVKPGADGSYAVADFQPASGAPLPIKVRMGKTGDAFITKPVLPELPASPQPPVNASPGPAIQSEPYTHQKPDVGDFHIIGDGFPVIGDLVARHEICQNYSQTLPLAPDGRLSVDNVNGRIEIAGWDRNEVSIKALKHGKTPESVEAVKIKVESSPDEISIHTEQPSSKTGFPSSWFGFKDSSRNDATVEYAIQVPRNAQLKNISSVNGKIVIDAVAGDIEASTVNGEAQIKNAAGDLKLSTVNGRIKAELASLGNGQSVSLSTVNGQIEATLPANANAEVSANTLNGSLSSDFPALVVQKEFPVSKKLKGTLGNGGGRVKASTVNGGIHFRKGADAK